MPKPDRVSLAADQQPGFVEDCQPREQHRIDAPSDQIIAAIPQRRPGQARQVNPEYRLLYSLPPRRGATDVASAGAIDPCALQCHATAIWVNRRRSPTLK